MSRRTGIGDEVAARIEAYAASIAATFPPLTDGQLDVIASLLRDGSSRPQQAGGRDVA